MSSFVPPTLAWLSFGSATMLWLAVGILVPLLIHHWSRRRYRQQRWAAMQFLLAAMKRNARRIRLEHLLLLALRCLAVLLLALALADASCQRTPDGEAASPDVAATFHVLVVDGSYSMAARHGTKNRFDAALTRVRETIDAAPQGDAFSIVLMADPPQVIVPGPAFDPADVLGELNRITRPDTGADIFSTIAEVKRRLDAAGSRYPELRRRVTFFTDLQATTWNAAAESAGRKALDELAKAASLRLFEIGEQDRENLAVIEIRQRDAYVTTQSPAAFEARIRNFGTQDRADHTVDFFINDRLAHRTEVNVPAGEQTRVVFTPRWTAPGRYVVEARADDGLLPVDDSRFITVEVVEAIRVLCVEGKPGAAESVAHALSPGDAQPSVRVKTATDGALWEHNPADFHCIFFCNVPRFTPSDAQRLRDYLEDGGGAVFFLGDRVVPDDYNRYLAQTSLPEGILPASIGPIVRVDAGTLDPRGYDHPLVEPFRGREYAGLLTTPVWRYFHLTPHEEPSVATALWLENGDPLLVEGEVGAGRVILVATAGSIESVDTTTQPPTPWTALSEWHSFLPLVQLMLGRAVRNELGGQQRQVGTALTGDVPPDCEIIPPQVTAPDGGVYETQLGRDSAAPTWHFDETYQRGVYRLATHRDDVDKQPFAVNLDPREGDLTTTPREELPESLTAHVDSAASKQTAGEPTSPGRRLFRYVLGALLALLIVEMMFAWRLGNRTA